MSDVKSDSRALSVFGLCSMALYIVLAVFFWTAWSFKANAIDEVILFVATGALVTLYFWGLKFAKRAATSAIVIFAIGVGVVGFFTPPFDSTDIFFYMATGWQQAHYGANPYSVSLRSVE